MSRLFRHVEPGRTIVFGPGALAASTDLLGAGYTLLSTARALASQPDLARGAARTFATLAPLVEDDATLHTAVATAADRPEMTRFDPPHTADEIEAIYRAAGRGSAQQSIRGI
ncbi:MAG: hypothetical protein JOY65_08220 [Acetobacteraceae bacterium]|nr:hypothetical protein [Acetobacteraceae bacterium]